MQLNCPIFFSLSVVEKKTEVEETLKKEIELATKLDKENKAMQEEHKQMSAEAEKLAKKTNDAQTKLENVSQAKVWNFETMFWL